MLIGREAVAVDVRLDHGAEPIPSTWLDSGAMPVPDHLLRFWRAFDARNGRVQPTWWGAVVTDARFPFIWDANYARVETDDRALTADEVEAALLPALAEAGASTVHVVGFRPESQAPLFAELEARGHVPAWDVVMELDGDLPATPALVVEELGDGDELRAARMESFALFGIDDPEVRAQAPRARAPPRRFEGEAMVRRAGRRGARLDGGAGGARGRRIHRRRRDRAIARGVADTRAR